MLQFMKSNRVMAGALVALIVVAAHAAAAKGGKAQTSVTVTLDDADGDEIRSDGFGSYTGNLGGRYGSLTLSTGEDSLFFDFSNDVYPGAVSPFGAAANSGYLDDVAVTADQLDGDAGTTSFVTVLFEFVAPAPDGSGPTDWQLLTTMEVARKDTTGDGAADTFVLTRPAADPFPFYAYLSWHTDPVHDSATGPRRGPPYKDDGWRSGGTFDMDWGAVIEK